MLFFGCDIDSRVFCLISDSVFTKSKISVDSFKRLFGCLSHKLNLQVNKNGFENVGSRASSSLGTNQCWQKRLCKTQTSFEISPTCIL